MVRRSHPFLFAALLLLSCGQGPGDAASTSINAPTAPVERVVNEVPSTSGAPATVADLHISGMGCEMMCGSAIRKALASLPGVANVEIRFDADQEVDHAVVTYDEAAVSDEALVASVSKLHDGQYRVHAVHITRHTPAAARAGDGEEAARRKELGAARSFHVPVPSLPNVLAVLARILRL